MPMKKIEIPTMLSNIQESHKPKSRGCLGCKRTGSTMTPAQEGQGRQNRDAGMEAGQLLSIVQWGWGDRCLRDAFWDDGKGRHLEMCVAMWV